MTPNFEETHNEIKYKKVVEWYWDDGDKLELDFNNMFPEVNTPFKMWLNGFISIFIGIFMILTVPILIGSFRKKVYYIKIKERRK